MTCNLFLLQNFQKTFHNKNRLYVLPSVKMRLSQLASGRTPLRKIKKQFCILRRIFLCHIMIRNLWKKRSSEKVVGMISHFYGYIIDLFCNNLWCKNIQFQHSLTRPGPCWKLTLSAILYAGLRMEIHSEFWMSQLSNILFFLYTSSILT